MFFKSVVPDYITELEFNFIKSINPLIKDKNSEGFGYIDISPEAYNGEYHVSCCQINVAKKIEKDGGKRLIGWCIWKSPVLLEAEYHHVWVSPEGNIVDITPQSDKGETILFVVDPEQKDDGLPVLNKRKILKDIPEVRKMIELQDRIYFYRKKYQIPYSNNVQFPNQKELQFFQNLQMKLQGTIIDIEHFLSKTRK